jgi:hyperosmotically inducible periplasmic protein
MRSRLAVEEESAMSRIFPAALLFVLAGCGDPAPPTLKPAPPPPVAAPAPAAEAKAPEAPKPDPNKELAARVKHALEDEAKIQAAGIDVTSSDGVVTLWGTTTSDDERTRAARVAGKVEGVKSVDNKLAVVRGS